MTVLNPELIPLRNSLLNYLCKDGRGTVTSGSTEYGFTFTLLPIAYKDVKVSNAEFTKDIEAWADTAEGPTLADWSPDQGPKLQENHAFRYSLIGLYVVTEAAYGEVAVEEFATPEEAEACFDGHEERFAEWQRTS